MPLYEKPVRLLMKDMVQDLALRPDDVFDRDRVLEWFTAKYKLVKEGTITAHLIRLSINAPLRVHYSPKPDGSDDVFFQLDGSHFRLYNPAMDPAPIRVGAPSSEPSTSSKPTEDSEFAYEHDLRDFLAKNLHLVAPGLRLYQEEGITGVEFPVGGRFVDILAIDSQGRYVVIELKVSKGYDRVIGQLLRYMGWIEKHHADPGQKVRGIIVAKEISNDLKLACGRIADVSLFEYSLSVSWRAVEIES